uniref:Uncharacterized protein n=1 Tax=Candidatus Kentrum sp. TC TaxID=2126339 RepID=A0A450ZW55_9GAMM|nr:MAG: hypothetical protein BECKTC1821F_GA0114240_102115 [Candidatus Kentron sp. TC]
MNPALFQYRFTLESLAPYSIVSYWKRLTMEFSTYSAYNIRFLVCAFYL